MTNLAQVIHGLSTKLAHDIIAALKQASLDELVLAREPSTRARAAMRAGASRSRHRRSEAEIQKLAEKIVAVICGRTDGISAEELKSILNLPSGRASQKVIAGPIATALAAKRVRKTGTRRATRYFAG